MLKVQLCYRLFSNQHCVSEDQGTVLLVYISIVSKRISRVDCSQPSIFSYFSVIAERRKIIARDLNLTPAQNGMHGVLCWKIERMLACVAGVQRGRRRGVERRPRRLRECEQAISRADLGSLEKTFDVRKTTVPYFNKSKWVLLTSVS